MSAPNLTYPQRQRLLWIDKQIRENKYPNTSQIAEKFEITPKTAQRDLDFLRDTMKLPLCYSAKNRGWYYTEPVAYSLSLINIFEGELVALLLAEKLAKQYRGLAIEKKLQKAFNKILLAATDVISIDLVALSDAYSFEANLAPELNYETLEILEQAIRESKSLKMVYFTAQSGSVSSRQLPWRKRLSITHMFLKRMKYAPGRISVKRCQPRQITVMPGSFICLHSLLHTALMREYYFLF